MTKTRINPHIKSPFTGKEYTPYQLTNIQGILQTLKKIGENLNETKRKSPETDRLSQDHDDFDLAYIAAHLERAGYRYTVYDAVVNVFEPTVEIPPYDFSKLPNIPD